MNEIIKLNLTDIKNAVFECVSRIQRHNVLLENANERKRQETAHNETLNVVRSFFKNGEWLDTVKYYHDKNDASFFSFLYKNLLFIYETLNNAE